MFCSRTQQLLLEPFAELGVYVAERIGKFVRQDKRRGRVERWTVLEWHASSQAQVEGSQPPWMSRALYASMRVLVLGLFLCLIG